MTNSFGRYPVDWPRHVTTCVCPALAGGAGWTDNPVHAFGSDPYRRPSVKCFGLANLNGLDKALRIGTSPI